MKEQPEEAVKEEGLATILSKPLMRYWKYVQKYTQKYAFRVRFVRGL